MRTSVILFIFLTGIVQFTFFACTNSVEKKVDSFEPQKILALDNAGYHLPDRPGYDLFLANCGVCHSYRYIQMQPNFSRKTWEKTVDKMVHTFGAPVPDSSVAPIVDYLMAIRGKK